MNDKDSAEVISFGKAADPHKEARKEAKLKNVQRAFKAVLREKLKSDREESRKKKPKHRKKKR